MSEIDKLVQNLDRKTQAARQSQLRFVICTAVDWEAKTMDAIGSSDGVEYLDITLGFGYVDIKPAIESTCLIGIIDGQEVATFLVNAEEVELVEIKGKEIIINEGENMGIPTSPNLVQRLNAIETAFNALLKDYTTHNHAHPQGATTGLLAPPSATDLQLTKVEDIANPNITH